MIQCFEVSFTLKKNVGDKKTNPGFFLFVFLLSTTDKRKS